MLVVAITALSVTASIGATGLMDAINHRLRAARRAEVTLAFDIVHQAAA